MPSELESDLQDTVVWGGNLLVDFSAGKTQLVSFNNTGAIDVKMDGSLLEKKSYFDMLRLIFSSKLSWGFYTISIISISMTGSTGLTSLFSREITCYSDRLHDFSVTILMCYKDFYVNSFFSCTARLWNSLAIECFPLTYDLNGFKYKINRHLLL